jgi:glutamate racemase
VPYGDRASDEIVELTRACVETLFSRGAKLVLLGCNTATAVAARRLQQNWLPKSPWQGKGHNVLGIVAPTVEAATQTPWAVTTPQYPQKYLTDRIAVFGTTRTIASNVYLEEIKKRCPRVEVIQQVCSELAGAIEAEAREPAATRILAQPAVVADSLEDYLARRPQYTPPGEASGLTLLTTGDPRAVSARARIFWRTDLVFEKA